MRVHVGPAKRDGHSTTIFDQSLEPADISADTDGEICISFCAGGMYDGKSSYRYTMRLTRGELSALVGQMGAVPNVAA